ncbi:MAG TPA: hypothetical protein VGJ78_17280 [Vicinamibacterales bacterium]|jgi:hypothetical protein
MKRIVLIALGVAAASIGAFAQTPDIDTPLLALPQNLRADAGVIKWKPDHTYDTLRPSKNMLVCYDRSGFPLQQPFSLECTDQRNLERVKQNLDAEALGDRMKSEAKLNEQEKAGTRVKPVFGSVWYHLAGMSKEMARTHMTIAVPGATQATMGLPENGRGGGVWIMSAGTSTAHLMTPGE